MAEHEIFEALERQIEAVLASESTDFFEMAAMLGLDPKKDFAGADLSGVDLAGKDLSQANFTGTNLRGTRLYRILCKRSIIHVHQEIAPWPERKKNRTASMNC